MTRVFPRLTRRGIEIDIANRIDTLHAQGTIYGNTIDKFRNEYNYVEAGDIQMRDIGTDTYGAKKYPTRHKNFMHKSVVHESARKLDHPVRTSKVVRRDAMMDLFVKHQSIQSLENHIRLHRRSLLSLEKE